jgi:hypothetical protein
MVDIPDAWHTFAQHYLTALDACAARPSGKASRSWESMGWTRRERTDNLAEWHQLLLPRLVDEDDTAADRLAHHPALGGPHLAFLQAQLARLRGDVDQARKLVHEALTYEPGNTDFLAVADEIGSGQGARARRR